MKLFLCYAHEDKYTVGQLVEIIRLGGHDPWFDIALIVGPEWESQLLNAIRSCEAFLYALSPESVASEWCQWEFAQAVKMEKPIIPVLLQQNTPLPDTLSRYQYADFTEGPTGEAVARLMHGLWNVAVNIRPEDAPEAPRQPRGVPAQAVQDAELTLDRATITHIPGQDISDSGDLNDPTSEIVHSNRSPLRVVAGPGTGKTSSLMQRIARLLREGVDPGQILLVTFTRAAANDLEQELGKLAVSGVGRIRKGTLHAFCFSILQQANVFLLTGRVARTLFEFEQRFLLEDLKSDDVLGKSQSAQTALKSI